MPTYLRAWYIQKLADTKEKEIQNMQKASKKSSSTTPTIHQPTFEKPQR